MTNSLASTTPSPRTSRRTARTTLHLPAAGVDQRHVEPFECRLFFALAG
ncbi:hypothetical protein OHS58_28860 [Amycolatopsis sp. NBC_00348]